MRDLPKFGCKPASLSADFYPQTEDSFSKFLLLKNVILALKGVWANHLTFSGYDTRVTWILFFVHQATGHRVRGIDFRSYLPLMVSLLIQTLKSRGIDLLFPLSVAYHVTSACPSSRTVCLSSSLTLLDNSSSSNRLSQYEMSTFNFWASVLLGVHSFIIYSFLLDTLTLETSRLDVNSGSIIYNHFLPCIKLTAQG